MRVLRGEAPHLSAVKIKKQIFVSCPNDPVILQGNAMPDKMSFLLGIALSFVPFLPALCFSLSEGDEISSPQVKGSFGLRNMHLLATRLQTLKQKRAIWPCSKSELGI